MQAGSVVIYRDRGQLALGILQKIKTNTKGSVELLGEGDKRLALQNDRIFLDSKETIASDVAPKDRKKRLKLIRERISSYSDSTDIRELWELLKAEDNSTFTWRELAELVVSGNDPLAMAGALDALWQQSLYFKEKNPGSFSPRDPNSVEQGLLQGQREAQKARQQQDFLTWIETRTRTELLADPPEGSQQFVNLIKGLALYGDAYEQRPAAQQLLNIIGLSGKENSRDTAFQILVDLGIWEVNEELGLLRYHIPTRFSDEALQAAEDQPAFRFRTDDPSPTAPSEDLTTLDTFTIDDSDTEEIDDALSLTVENGDTTIGIHIADAGHYAPPHSLLDKSALARGTTIYLPSGRYPMLPHAIGSDKASLVAGSERPALSFFVRVTESGELAPVRITRSIVNVKKRMSYEDADNTVCENASSPYGALLTKLSTLAERRKTKRVEQGAVIIDSDEVKVKVSRGVISVIPLTSPSRSRAMVSECMIMANEAAARYLQEHDLPAVYISQPPPDSTLPDRAALPTRQTYVHATRRLMNPSSISTMPERHSALGVPSYTQVTSPLRRYVDLQMHHQIKHHLATRQSLFHESQLQIVAASVQPAIADARKCERESVRFWLLRLMEEQQGNVVQGQVIREQHRRAFVELADTLLIAPINNQPEVRLGSSVEVRINHVDARKDLLSIRLVGTQT